MGYTINTEEINKVIFHYPNLVIDVRDGCVMLCTDTIEQDGSKFGAILVHKPEDCVYHRPEGSYSPDWIKKFFKPYRGSITFKND